MLGNIGYQNYDLTAITIPCLSNFDPTLYNLLPLHWNTHRTISPAYFQLISALKILPFSNKLIWLYSNLLAKVAVPDIYFGWDKIVYKYIKSCRKKYDIIISSSGTYTSHLSANLLRQEFDTIWIADLGDPWATGTNNKFLLKSSFLRNQQLEFKTLTSASGVIFTTNETEMMYKYFYKGVLPTSTTIAYGYREEDFKNSISLKHKSERYRKIRISHIGVAYKSNRNLGELINAINKHLCIKQKIILQIIGPHSRSFEQIVQNQNMMNVSFCGRINYEESIHSILNSDVLIVFGNKSFTQIPGKTYIYLASGKPILYIGQVDPTVDPTYKLLQNYSGIIYSRDNADSLIDAIKYIIDNYQIIAIESENRRYNEKLSVYESKSLTKSFVNFLDILG